MSRPLWYLLVGLPGISACLLGAFGLYAGVRILVEDSRRGRRAQALPLVRATVLRSAGLLLVGTQFLLFVYVGVEIARGPLWLWPLVIGLALMVAGSTYWRYVKRRVRETGKE